jgi:hypothetical protein
LFGIHTATPTVIARSGFCDEAISFADHEIASPGKERRVRNDSTDFFGCFDQQ